MQTEKQIWGDSFVADTTTLQAKQHYFVKRGTASSHMTDVTAIGDPAIGILQDDPPTGTVGNVMRQGRSQLVVDGSTLAISVGSPIMCSAAGRGILASGVGNRVLAVANEATSALDAVIEVDVDCAVPYKFITTATTSS